MSGLSSDRAATTAHIKCPHCHPDRDELCENTRQGNSRISLCFRQHWQHCVGCDTLIRRGLGWQQRRYEAVRAECSHPRFFVNRGVQNEWLRGGIWSDADCLLQTAMTPSQKSVMLEVRRLNICRSVVKDQRCCTDCQALWGKCMILPACFVQMSFIDCVEP